MNASNNLNIGSVPSGGGQRISDGLYFQAENSALTEVLLNSSDFTALDGGWAGCEGGCVGGSIGHVLSSDIV